MSKVSPIGIYIHRKYVNFVDETRGPTDMYPDYTSPLYRCRHKELFIENSHLIGRYHGINRMKIAQEYVNI